MMFQALQLGSEPMTPRSEAFRLACFSLIIANIAYLVGVAIAQLWILDASGQPVHTDFTAVYAAGRLVLDGHPAAAYDWTVHSTMNACLRRREPTHHSLTA